MAEAPSGDDTLQPDDAADILEELLEAQNESRTFGLKLKLPVHEVEAICERLLDPRDRLLQIIIAFLRQAEPRPTWRVIVDALRSPIVNLTALARRVEAAHFPDLAAARDVVPETTDTEPAVNDTAAAAMITTEQHSALARRVEAAHFPDLTATPPPPPATATATSSESVKKTIEELKTRFRAIKDNTRECLEKQRDPVKRVADSLTLLSPDDDDRHKMFAESHVNDLFRAANVAEQFGTMNTHWNYLDPSLLDHLVSDFNLEEVKGEMETYKSDLGQFRRKTPLTLFCRAQRKKRVRLSPDFQEVVTEFDWPNDVTLEVVEQFRQEYASHYNLHEFAMMVAQVRPGCFIVTWFVPESVVEKLKGKVPRAILKTYSVTKLEIAGTCVYRLRKPQEAVPSTSSGPVSAATATLPGATPSLSSPKPASEEDYLFVEAPSEEFYCPVIFGLLLEPHLTSCCGKHLSQEAATRIQGGGGACPLCNAPSWITILDKRFQRQVKSLCVFCCHEERGCGWQGELGTLDSHAQSCPMRDAPLMTELLKLPLYGGDGATADTRMDRHSSQLTQPGLLATTVPHSMPAKPRKLTVQCHQKKRAPHDMIRGSAATDGRFVYITPYGSNSFYQYECSTEEWMELPSCPYEDSGLAIIDSELTTVGGLDGAVRTNRLFTLRQGKWVEVYPPMNTARSSPAVVTTSDGDYLIAIGGYDSDGVTATVELFQVMSRRWYTLTDLPQPLYLPSATICGDQLYVIGHDGNGHSCSLQSLPSNDRPITSPLTLSWKPLPPLPVHRSTAATLCGQLVLIGGRQGSWTSVDSIHQLVEGQWVEIGSMTRGRWLCLAVSLSPDRILIVGGEGGDDSVEECVAVSFLYHTLYHFV